MDCRGQIRRKPTQEEIKAAQEEFIRRRSRLESYTPFDIERQGHSNIYQYLGIHYIPRAVATAYECIDRLTDRLMSLNRFRGRYIRIGTIAEEGEEDSRILYDNTMSGDRRLPPRVSAARPEVDPRDERRIVPAGGVDARIANAEANHRVPRQLPPIAGTARVEENLGDERRIVPAGGVDARIANAEVNLRIPRQLPPISGAARAEENPRDERRIVPAEEAFNEAVVGNPTVSGRLPNVLGEIVVSEDEDESVAPITKARQEEKDFAKRVYYENDSLDILEKVKKVLQFISERENREQMPEGKTDINSSVRACC